MKFGIFLIMVGCFVGTMAVMNRHPMFCVAGILFLIVATLRIRAIRNRG